MWLSAVTVLLVAVKSFDVGLAQSRKAVENAGKKQYQVQHGACSYTFLLPEVDSCRSAPANPYVSNSVQRDAPLDYDDSVQRLQLLENIMENNTQWLLKVFNQTSRLELQLLEHSFSTNKLERQISDQTNEITKLQDKNSHLENKVLSMEDKHTRQLQSMKEEKDKLQTLVLRQNSIIEDLEKQLMTASSNNSMLQKQQHDLMETVHNLLTRMTPQTAPRSSFVAKEEQLAFKDCAEAFKSGLTSNGIYTLTMPNTTEQVKTYCDMKTGGGGWTVIQKRFDGSVDFHRTWKEYKKGFGDPSGEYWLGNELVAQLTNPQRYVLKIQLKDWEGNEAYSLYDQFYLGTEAQKYKIHLKGYTGTAGKINSISQPGNDFSTKDADNDKCICKCSQMATGGWWFDACGPSNLNGMYYSLGQNTNKFNGIKWYYWKGSGYSLKATTMMIRPADF
ncbi:PREDICTED: angiopoietin-2 isoform X7 [Nanorana parkeri]|uniref:angiopoietin-2 isoform X7 n=1 Tax=Nanorana parkeri TaxID=125878 RepID=UPI000854323D|nr:PREDICTED: angiopoietin-2 isoform X7 [Nanorana parkeri]